MRGGQTDNNIGMISKAGQMSAPYDRIVMDTKVLHPNAFVPQTRNEKFLLFTRRNRPEDRIQTVAQATPNNIDPRVPNVLMENGYAPLPYAGIYKYL